MSEASTTTLHRLERDLALRGYSETEIDELLQLPVLIIPGPITPLDSDEPLQKLTNHVAFLHKDLEREGISSRVVLRRDSPRKYVEERHAHIDLGTIVIGLATAHQLGAFANIAQILDFLLNLIQFKLSAGRTADLTPDIKFDLEIHNGERMARLQIEGRADGISKMLTPGRVEAMLASLQEPSE